MNIEKVVREYLPNVIHLSLGTSRDNKPWVCEVHFAYDDDLNLYFRSLANTRHCQELTENPNVAGNIVRQHQPGEMPHGIYFEGTAKHLQPGAEMDKAFECIKQRFNKGQEILDDATRPDGVQFYKVTVQTWYTFGKLEQDGPKKYELTWNGGKK